MPKMRSDFVTNSSSSSFIIARAEDCTPEHLYNVLDSDELRGEIEAVLQHFNTWSVYESALREIVDELLASYDDEIMLLDGWQIHHAEFSGGGLSDREIDDLIYACVGEVDDPLVKIKRNCG